MKIVRRLTAEMQAEFAAGRCPECSHAVLIKAYEDELCRVLCCTGCQTGFLDAKPEGMPN